MHPEILREIGSQRDSDMRARADQVRLARTASRAFRAARRARRAADEAGALVVPAVPDYVDGTFVTTPADEQAAGRARRIPVGRRAA
jgi:hypothetical protein